MYYDFGAGEEIVARHEDEQQQKLKSKDLRRLARKERARASWLSSPFGRLRSEIDLRKLVVALQAWVAGSSKPQEKATEAAPRQ